VSTDFFHISTIHANSSNGQQTDRVGDQRRKQTNSKTIFSTVKMTFTINCGGTFYGAENDFYKLLGHRILNPHDFGSTELDKNRNKSLSCYFYIFLLDHHP